MKNKLFLLLVCILGCQSYYAFASSAERQDELIAFKQLRPCIQSSTNPLVSRSIFTPWKTTDVRVAKNGLKDVYCTEMNAMHNLNSAIHWRMNISLAANMMTTVTLLYTNVGSNLWSACSKVLPNNITSRHDSSSIGGTCLAAIIGCCVHVVVDRITGCVADDRVLCAHRNFLVQKVRSVEVASVRPEIIERLESERSAAPWRKDRYVMNALKWFRSDN